MDVLTRSLYFCIMQVEIMDAAPLNVRFFNSALLPLTYFLNLTGVPFGQHSVSTRKSFLIRFWSVILLVVCMQGNIYTAIKRAPFFGGFFNFLQNVEGIIHELVTNMIRLSALTVATIVHIALVFHIGPRIELFIESLESVDCVLKRPNLSQVNRISIIGLIYTLFMVRYIKLHFNAQCLNSIQRLLMFNKCNFIFNLKFSWLWIGTLVFVGSWITPPDHLWRLI